MYNKLEITKIKEKIESLLDNHTKKIINEIKLNKGKAYLVGGAVRDLILNKDIYDLDIEVHYIDLNRLKSILELFSKVNLVGKSFGILKLESSNIDWSLPRKDKGGRKPIVEIDPYMDIKEALKRRDLTINAIAIDLFDYKIVDPFNGISDIKNRILRSPDINFFEEDPLRFFRVMQFIARFNMYPNEELNERCKKVNIDNLSIERIEAEFKKMLLKSQYPSKGIRWLNDIDRLKDILPDLDKTKYIKQDIRYHPEIWVFEHLMQTLDAASFICDISNIENTNDKLAILYSALFHDIGKIYTTKIIDKKIISYNHEVIGYNIVKNSLKKILTSKKLIEEISILIRYHMAPLQFIKQNSKAKAYKKLALKLAKNCNIYKLSRLSLADLKGRNGKENKPKLDCIECDNIIDKFTYNANKYGVLFHPIKALITGKDLLEFLNEGTKIGEILKYAYKIQIDNNINNKDDLLKYIIKKLKLKNKN